jgi:hypothetical protein
MDAPPATVAQDSTTLSTLGNQVGQVGTSLFDLITGAPSTTSPPPVASATPTQAGLASNGANPPVTSPSFWAPIVAFGVTALAVIGGIFLLKKWG